MKVVDGSGAGQRAKVAGRVGPSLAHIRRIFLPFPWRDSLTFQNCLLIIIFLSLFLLHVRLLNLDHLRILRGSHLEIAMVDNDSSPPPKKVGKKEGQIIGCVSKWFQMEFKSLKLRHIPHRGRAHIT